MKKLLMFLCTVTFVFGVVGAASAIPMMWTETIDWGKDEIYLKDADSWHGELSDSFNYYHDLGTDGFVSFFEGGNDYVDQYTLSIGLYDNATRTAGAIIFQPGLFDSDTVTTYNFSMDFVEIGWTFAGLLDINHDGTLNISVEPTKGDFYLDWSKITAFGDNGDTVPVPEPATMFLMGVGLLALGNLGTRIKKS